MLVSAISVNHCQSKGLKTNPGGIGKEKNNSNATSFKGLEGITNFIMSYNCQIMGVLGLLSVIAIPLGMTKTGQKIAGATLKFFHLIK